ncbi:MAG: type II secretion system protein [Bryobacteraceae bacterium]
MAVPMPIGNWQFRHVRRRGQAEARAPECTAQAKACATTRGFTFVELMVVISIILLLITMAIPIYQKTIVRAKESVLKNNLFTLRTVIDNYSYDKMKAPQSLQDLVSEGYLKEVPMDPMTASNSTWKTIMEDASQALNQSEPGIFDVRSGSDKTSLDGTAYADW